jgi:hypothetical protein
MARSDPRHGRHLSWQKGGDEDDYAEALFYLTPTPTTPA